MLLCNYKQLFFYGEQYITRLNVIGPGTPRLRKWISGSKQYAEISLEVNFVMRFNACSALSTNKFRSCRKWCERGTVSELETRCLFLSFTVTAHKVIRQHDDRWAGWHYWKKKKATVQSSIHSFENRSCDLCNESIYLSQRQQAACNFISTSMHIAGRSLEPVTGAGG